MKFKRVIFFFLPFFLISLPLKGQPDKREPFNLRAMRKLVKEYPVNSARAALVFASLKKSRWDLLLKIREKISVAQFVELKALGDSLGVSFQEKLSIKESEPGYFKLDQYNVNFQVVKNSKKIKINGVILSLDKGETVRGQYRSLKKRLASQSARNFFEELLVSRAKAETTSDSLNEGFPFPGEEARGALSPKDLSYDLLVLFYYMKNFTGSNGNIEAEFNSDPRVLFLIHNLNINSDRVKKVYVECKEKGVTFTFSDNKEGGYRQIFQYSSVGDVSESTGEALSEAFDWSSNAKRYEYAVKDSVPASKALSDSFQEIREMRQSGFEYYCSENVSGDIKTIVERGKAQLLLDVERGKEGVESSL